MSIFKKIIDKEIPAKIVYEDEQCLAFEDISPQAPVHILVIPKKEIPSCNELTESDAAVLGRMFQVIKQLAAERGIAESGYRVVTNCGPDACQTVPHLHFHLLAGRQFHWPPG